MLINSSTLQLYWHQITKIVANKILSVGKLICTKLVYIIP